LRSVSLRDLGFVFVVAALVIVSAIVVATTRGALLASLILLALNVENGEQAALNGSETRLQRPETGPRHACRLALAALVLAFAVLYPPLNAGGSCGEPGCPHFAHAPVSVEAPAGVFVALLAAIPAAPVLARRVCRPVSDRKPAEFYPSPQPDPPRLHTGQRVIGAGSRPGV
jgi:hypothetical protein